VRRKRETAGQQQEPLLGEESANEQRLAEALRALRIMPVFPLWGVRQIADGTFVCECGKGDCPWPGKHPRRSGWKQRASSDPVQIRDWLERYPLMNFGAVIPEDMFVIDADVKERRDRTVSDGRMMIDYLELAHGKRLGDTVRVWSGGGERRFHAYFRSLDGEMVGCKTDAIDGVDVKGAGAYAILPGSRHQSGSLYAWEEECSPEDVAVALRPNWLAAILAPPVSNLITGSATRLEDLDRELLRDYGIDIHAIVVNPFANLPTWRLTKLLNRRKTNHLRIMATWDMARGPNSRYPLADYSPSGYEMALAVFAACNGWKPQQIVDLLVIWRHRHDLPVGKLHPERDVQTLRNAYAAAIERARLKRRRPPSSALRINLRTEVRLRPELLQLKPKGIAKELGLPYGQAVRKMISRVKREFDRSSA
jgi:hypothetical protein